MKKISSILFVLLLMLASFTAGTQYPRGDVDQDGQVTVSDVTCLIDYLLNGAWDDEPVDGHEWVDLGLPSGTLWATYNLGAAAPEEYGDYFAWGETEPKDVYSWTTYKWCNGSYYTLTKYCTDSSFGYNGFVDNKTELDPEDDAAYVIWGENWRMPTPEQLQELIDHCTWTWTPHNGMDGYLVTGPNGNTLFLPAAGYYYGGSLYSAGSSGSYRSRALYSSDSDYVYGMNIYSEDVELYFYNRTRGFSVRAVRVPQN